MSGSVKLFRRTCASVFLSRNKKECVWKTTETLFCQPVLSFNTTANVKAEQSMKIFTRPRPIIAFHNWMYTALVNGYYKLDFSLQDFCDSCPLVAEEIVQRLVQGNAKNLNEAVDSECLNNIVMHWNELPENAKQFLSTLNNKNFYCRYPTIRMRLPDKINPSKELTSFLNISIQIFFFASAADMLSMTERERLMETMSFLADMKIPIIHNFVFEREITKDVVDSWKLLSCGSFPSSAITFTRIK